MTERLWWEESLQFDGNQLVHPNVTACDFMNVARSLRFDLKTQVLPVAELCPDGSSRFAIRSSNVRGKTATM